MDIIKKCKKHGRQYVTYSYCPYCGNKLEEEEINKEFILPVRKSRGDDITDLAHYEAIGTAWVAIGLSGVVGFRLADKDITPSELQKIIKTYVIKGIGEKSLKIIEGFTKEDFERFDQCYESLIQNNSWAWGLAKWRYRTIGDECTNYDYEKMKNRLKKLFDKKLKRQIQQGM